MIPGVKQYYICLRAVSGMMHGVTEEWIWT